MLRVVSAGALSTVQDAGRPGFGLLGVPRSGACDVWSMVVANRLIGNDPDAAVLEMTLLGPELSVERDLVIGLAGAELEAIVVEEGRPLAAWCSHGLAAGTTVRFGPAIRGVRAYLALPGGIDVEPILGSRSTCLAGSFGGLDGRPIAPGDQLAPMRAAATAAVSARHWPGEFDPTDPALPVRIVAVEGAPGVAPDAFTSLVSGPWSVSPLSDRSGARLEGPRLPTVEATGVVRSRGTLPGAIQVLPSGEPIVLLTDAPTIGGYPVAAIVVEADLPVVAQRGSGDALRFVPIDEADARAASGARRASLGAAREGA